VAGGIHACAAAGTIPWAVEQVSCVHRAILLNVEVIASTRAVVARAMAGASIQTGEDTAVVSAVSFLACT
jgi:hypothetical protein